MTAHTRGPEQEGAPAQPEYDAGAAAREAGGAAAADSENETRFADYWGGRGPTYEAQAHADQAPEPAWWDGQRMTTGRGREAEEEQEAGS